MNKLAEKLVKESKTRWAALKGLFRPYTRIFTIISYAALAYVYLKASGRFSLLLIGLVLLVFFLSLSPRYAPPIAGIPLLGRRMLALLIDFLLLSIASFLALFTLQSEIYLGYLTMVVVWGAFLYFVLLDCFLNGTFGKKICGIKVVDFKTPEASFRKLIRAFLRVFFTLAFPIISSGLLRDILMGDGSSRLRFISGEGAARFALYLIPMSILFLRGNQSITDKILGVSVQQKRQRIDTNPPKTKPSTWVALVCSTIVLAFLYAGFAYAAVGRFLTTGLPDEPPAKNFQQVENITDPKLVEPLWVYLPMNLREPETVVRKIEIFEASPNPFTFRSEDSHIITPLNPAPYLNDVKRVRIVRVSLAPYTFTVARMTIVRNFLAIVEQSATTHRPSFVLLQIASEQKYGLFSIASQENILLSWMGTNTKPIDFPMDLRAGFGVNPLFSYSEIYNLLLGNTWVIHQCCT